MEHFSSICNNPLTKNAPIILLMNKYDLFAKKLSHRRIKDVPEFCKYKGIDSSTTDGVNFFRKSFIGRFKPNGINKGKKINYFVTNLLDTEMTNEVILECKDLIENSEINLRNVEALPVRNSKLSSGSSRSSNEISSSMSSRSPKVIRAVADSSECQTITENCITNSSCYSQFENGYAIEGLRYSRSEDDS